MVRAPLVVEGLVFFYNMMPTDRHKSSVSKEASVREIMVENENWVLLLGEFTNVAVIEFKTC